MMGQAKLRGTQEQRIKEGIAKEEARQQELMLRNRAIMERRGKSALSNEKLFLDLMKLVYGKAPK